MMAGRLRGYVGVLTGKVGAVLNTPRRRIIAGVLAVVMVLGITIPLITIYMTNRRYVLTEQTEKILGPVSPYIAKKLTFDPATETYYLNREGIKSDLPLAGDDDPQAVAESLQQQYKQRVGGGNSKDAADDLPYSAKLPANPTEGITFYDNSLGLSFTLKPDFELKEGKLRGGRIVYPYGRDAQLVYSPKGNGLKEDLVLEQSIGDEVTLRYRLVLPETLEARMLPDGSGAVGIYSADPSLFGDISYGTDADVAKIESARRSAKKDYAAFTLPAPRLVTEGNLKDAKAAFLLSNDGKTLTLDMDGLDTASYPLAIDPSMVVTSTSEFAAGAGDAQNIDFATTGQIGRGALTGGSVGSWASTSSFTTARQAPTTVVYNGYIYVVGGYNVGFYNTVQYAPINSNGTIGTWNSTTAFTTARDRHASVAYNGYLYIIGGNDLNPMSNVQFARINSNGTVGAWQDTTSLGTARLDHTAAVYNGYLYVLGGNNSNVFTSGQLSDVQYAPINANGTLGAWTATTSFTNARQAHTTVVNNGYIYVIGGYYSSAVHNDVQYARINANGTVGSWTATTAFTTSRYFHASVVYNGYLYVIGGSSGSYLNTVQYALINANGTVGTWTTTAPFATGRWRLTAAAYNGYLYIMAGFDGTSYRNDVQYSKIHNAGVTSAYNYTTNLPGGLTDNASVAYNGYLYLIGGADNISGLKDTVDYAPINANGTIGSWTATSSFTTERYSMNAIAYNGYMYVLGGDGVGGPYNDVQYAAINSDGTLGTFATTTSFPTTRAYFSATAYKGYMYVAGGLGTPPPGGAYLDTVHYAPINANGTIGSWTATTALATARMGLTITAYGNYLYSLGGNDAVGLITTAAYAPINANGTIGSWTATTAFADGRLSHVTVTSGGFIYVMGGEGDAGMLDDVQYAAINADGTLGTWDYTSSFNTVRGYAAGASYNGYLYVLGGWDGADGLDDVQYARVNNGGAGTAGSWAAASSFTTARRDHTTVAHNGYLYVIGGYDGTGPLNDVQYAAINADGTLGSWSSAGSSFTTARYEHATVVYNNYLYVLGGQDSGGTNYNDIQYAPINSNGTIGSWSGTTAFSTIRVEHTAVAYNGYMYVLGGYSSGYLNDVQYAPINANGTVGSWTATTSFGTARLEHASVVYNGYVYVIGGYSGDYLSDVQFAALNTNGTVGSWVTTTPFNRGRLGHNAIAYNGYLYVLGGYNAGTLNDMQYAPIGGNGTLGDWNGTVAFTTARYEYGAAVHNGYFYVVGGRTTGGVLNDTQYSAAAVAPRVARYSKVVALGVSGVPTAITYNGDLPGGAANISYRVAGADGVFGDPLTATSMPGGSTFDCATSDNSAYYYVMVSVVMDESGSGSFPEGSSGTLANLTDITVDYTGSVPDPSVRLRGGKYFSTDTQKLQTLDSCRVGHSSMSYPTSTVQDASGSFSYYFPDGMQQVGGDFTTGALNSFGVTRFNYLDNTAFGFAIPTDATITGVSVELYKRSTQNVSTTRYITDHTVQLIKGGTAQGTNKADTVTHWATGAFATFTYGNNTDKWGLTLTPADVNASNFGVRVTAQGKDSSGGTTSAEMDYVRVTVYYNPS